MFPIVPIIRADEDPSATATVIHQSIAGHIALRPERCLPEIAQVPYVGHERWRSIASTDGPIDLVALPGLGPAIRPVSGRHECTEGRGGEGGRAGIPPSEEDDSEPVSWKSLAT